MYIYKNKINGRYYVDVELDINDLYIFEESDNIIDAKKHVKNQFLMCDENYNRISYEFELKCLRKEKIKKINEREW